MSKPLLSIVIANYNYGRFLEEAIKSVIAQDVSEKVELIICDAASTDNSVDIIKKYAHDLPPNARRSKWPDDFKLQPSHSNSSNHNSPTHNASLISWWCSEKDGGQSAAFNKGFKLARGEWLTWLNADDILMPGAIDAFIKVIQKHPSAEWITANSLEFDDNDGRITKVAWGPHKQYKIFYKNHASYSVFGPTSFFRRELFEKIGGFDEKLHYAMDFDYWARLTMAGVRQTRLNYICWAFRIHKDSKTTGDRSTEDLNKPAEEVDSLRVNHGYSFQHRLSNVWYMLWQLSRIIDGSFFVRIYKRQKYIGQALYEMR